MMKKIYITIISILCLINFSSACMVSPPNISNYCETNCDKYETAQKKIQKFINYFDEKFWNDTDKYKNLQKILLENLLKVEDKLSSEGKLNSLTKFKIEYLKNFLKHDPNSKC